MPLPHAEPLAPALYLVATPIGNLADITLRALEVLRGADLIACEDTRHTQKLLTHYGIQKPAISYHEHNEAERAAELVAKIEGGARIALVSDAGMPGVSDPGYRVVTLAIDRGITVIPIPGPAAAIAALAASGLPTDSFRFHGFLPAKAGARRTALEALAGSEQTEVFYEAPHRIIDALNDVVATLGAGRRVAIARELTKIHEQFLRGAAADVLRQLQDSGEVRGEITLLIAKADRGVTHEETAASLPQRLQQIMSSEKIDEKTALKRLARETGKSKSELYRELQRTR